MSGTISFSTQRLSIRDINWNDLHFVHSLHSVAEVQMYATLGIPESLSESKITLKNILTSKVVHSEMSMDFVYH